MSVSKVVKGLLQKYLGKYIKGLDDDALSLKWSATELVDLQLQETLFDDMGLPMVLHRGFVGKLRLVIPWTQLATLSSSTKIVVELSDIYAVCVAKADVKYDAKDEAAKQQASKDKLVAAFEAQRKKALQEAEEAAKKNGGGKAGFVTNLIRQLLENLQVTVSRVHLCLIDNSSVPDRTFTVGFYIGELKLLSVKAADSEAHVEESSGLSFMKRASLKDMAIYINTTSTAATSLPSDSKPPRSPLLGASREETQRILLARMDPTRSGCSYVIRPTGFDMSLVFNGNASNTVPQMQVNLTLEVLALELAKAQYACVMGLLDTMSHYQLYARYRSFKPPQLQTQRPKGTKNCMAWWVYACDCVRSDVRLQATRRSWTRVVRLAKIRDVYVGLFFRALVSPKDKTIKAAVAEQDAKLEVEEIIHFRKLAYAKYEASPEAALAKQSYARRALGAVTSWIPSFGFGGKSSSESDNSGDGDSDWNAAMKEMEQKSTVTEDYQLKHAEDIGMQLLIKMPKILVSLVDASPERGPIISIALDSLDFQMIQRQKFLALRLHAMDLEVRDHVTKDSKFPLIISRIELDERDAAEPLLGLQMAMPPLDGSSSLSLRLRGRPLHVVANLPFLLGLSDFFAVQPVNLHALEEAMINALGAARQQSSAAIADALEAHKSLNIDILWLAPKILLPADCTEKEGLVAVVDLGQLKVTSAESLTASQIMDGAPPGSQHGAAASDETSIVARPAETLYDQIKVSLKDVKLLVAQYGHPAAWWSVDVQERAHLCLLQPVDVNVGVFFCIGGTVNSDDARLLLDLHLLPVRVAVTTTKLGQLMYLADAITNSLSSLRSNEVPTSTTARSDGARARSGTNSKSVPGAHHVVPPSKQGRAGSVGAEGSNDFTELYKVPQEEGQRRSRERMRDLEAQRFNSKFGWVEDDIELANKNTSLLTKVRIDGFSLAFGRDGYLFKPGTTDGGGFMDGYDVEDVLNVSLLAIGATYRQKTFSKRITARIGSFFIEDCFLTAQRGKPSFIMNAADTRESLADITGERAAPLDPLMDVTVHMVDPLDAHYANSPADIMVDASFRALTIILNQESLAKVILVFAKLAEQHGGDRDNSRDTSSPSPSIAAPAPEALPMQQKPIQQTNLNSFADFHCSVAVSASLKSVGLVLNAKKSPVLSVSLVDFGADVALGATRTDIAAWLTAVEIEDLTLPVNHDYRQILAPMFTNEVTNPIAPRGNTAAVPGHLAVLGRARIALDGSPVAGRSNSQTDSGCEGADSVSQTEAPQRLLTLGLTMLDGKCPHFQGYSMDVACEMATLRIVVLFRYIDEVTRYFLEGELMQAVNQNKNSALVQSASKSAAEYSEQISDAASKSAAAAYNATVGSEVEVEEREAKAAKAKAVREAAAKKAKHDAAQPPSSAIPRMRVCIASQVILVPVATDSREHVELRMARVVVGNVLERDLVAEAQMEAGTGTMGSGIGLIGSQERSEDALALNSLKSLIGMSSQRRSASGGASVVSDDDFESIVSGTTVDSDADFVDAASTLSGDADFANFADFDDIDATPVDGREMDEARAVLFSKFSDVGRQLAKIEVDFDGFSIITGILDEGQNENNADCRLLRNFVLARTGLKINVDTTSPVSIDIDLTRVCIGISTQQIACCLRILSNNLTEKGSLTYDELQLEETLAAVQDTNALTNSTTGGAAKAQCPREASQSGRRSRSTKRHRKGLASAPSTPAKQTRSGGGAKPGSTSSAADDWIVRPTLSLDVRLHGFEFELITALESSDEGAHSLGAEGKLPTGHGSQLDTSRPSKSPAAATRPQADGEDEALMSVRPNSLAKLSCGKIFVMFSMYNTGGGSTGMKLNLSLAHIALVDTRDDSSGFAAPFRRLLEIRSYEMPYAFTLTFSQGKVLRGSSVKKPRSRTGATPGVVAGRNTDRARAGSVGTDDLGAEVEYDMRVNMFLSGIRVVALEHAFALMNYGTVLQNFMASQDVTSAKGGNDNSETEAKSGTGPDSSNESSAVDQATAESSSSSTQQQENSETAGAEQVVQEAVDPSSSTSIYVNVHVHKPTVFLLQDLSYNNPTALALSSDIKIACSIMGPGSGPVSGTHAKLLLQNVRCYRSSVLQRTQPEPHAMDFLQPLQGTLAVCLQQKSDVAWNKLNLPLVQLLQPDDQICDASIKFSALALRVGFDDSLLITRALSCLLKAQAEAAVEETKKHTDKNNKSHADSRASSTAVVVSSSASMEENSVEEKRNDADSDEGETADGAAVEGPATKMLILANVNIPIVVVDLINDLGRRQLPLIQLRSRRLGVAVQMLEEYVDADVQLALNAVYYNEKLTVWEPMVEPWSCGVVYRQERVSDPAEILRQSPTRSIISVSAEERLDLNLTVELVQLLMENMTLISSVDFTNTDEDDPENVSLSNFYIEIENSLGLGVEVNEAVDTSRAVQKEIQNRAKGHSPRNLDSRHGAQSANDGGKSGVGRNLYLADQAESWVPLPTAGSHQLQLPSNLSAPKLGQNDFHLPSTRFVSVKVAQSWAPCDVNVDRVGISRYSLHTKCMVLHLTHLDLSNGAAARLATSSAGSEGKQGSPTAVASGVGRDYTTQYNLFFGRFNACLFEVTLLDSDGTPRSQPQRRTIRRPGMVEAQNNEFEANDGEMPDSAQPAAGATVVIGNPDPYLDIEMDVHLTLRNVDEEQVQIRVFRCRAGADGAVGNLFGGLTTIGNTIGGQKALAVLTVPVKHLLPRHDNKSGAGGSVTFSIARARSTRPGQGSANGAGPPLGSLTLDARKSSYEFTGRVQQPTFGRKASKTQQAPEASSAEASTTDAETAVPASEPISSSSREQARIRKNHKSKTGEPNETAFNPTVDYVCEVRIRSGRKVLEVRSGVKLLNQCAMDIDVQMDETAHPVILSTSAGESTEGETGGGGGAKRTSNPARRRQRLRVGGELCIPLHLLSKRGFISMRPRGRLPRGMRKPDDRRHNAYDFSKPQSLVSLLGSEPHRELTFQPCVAGAGSCVSIAMSIETDMFGQKFVRLCPALVVTNLVPLPLTLRTCLSGDYCGRSGTPNTDHDSLSGVDVEGRDEIVAESRAAAGELSQAADASRRECGEPRTLQPTESIKIHDVQRDIGLSLQVSLTIGQSLGPKVWSRPTLLMQQPKETSHQAVRKGALTVEQHQAREHRLIKSASTSSVQVLRLELPALDGSKKQGSGGRDDEDEAADHVLTYKTRLVFDILRAEPLADAVVDDEPDAHQKVESDKSKARRDDFSFPSQLTLILEVAGNVCSNSWHAKIYSEYLVLNYTPFPVLISEMPEASDGLEGAVVDPSRRHDGFSCGVNASLNVPALIASSTATERSDKQCEYFDAPVRLSLFSFVDEANDTFPALRKRKRQLRNNKEKAGQVAVKFLAPDGRSIDTDWSELFSIDRTNVPGSLSVAVRESSSYETAPARDGGAAAAEAELVSEESEWLGPSAAVQPAALERVTPISCSDIGKLQSLEMGVSVFAGPGAFFRTKVVNVFPRFHLFNHTTFSLAVRPDRPSDAIDSVDGGHGVVVIQPGTTVPFHVPRRAHSHSVESDNAQSEIDAKVSLCVVQPDGDNGGHGLRQATAWSAPFGIVELQNFVLMLRTASLNALGTQCANVQIRSEEVDGNITYILASVIANGERVVVEFTERKAERLAYRVENQCSFDTVLFHQLGHEPEPSHQVRPFESQRFTWDDPSAPHKLVVRVQRCWWNFGIPADATATSSGGGNGSGTSTEADSDTELGPSSREGGRASAQSGVIDPHWRPVAKALEIAGPDEFVHSEEVVVDLKDLAWQVPNSELRFQVAGPAPSGRILRMARKMDGPVVVLIITDLPFLMDNGKKLIQAELKQSLRQRRLKLAALSLDLERKVATLGACEARLASLQRLAQETVPASPRPHASVPWLWLDVAGLRHNGTWLNEGLRPGHVRSVPSNVRCELRFPRQTEGHIFRHGSHINGGQLLPLMPARRTAAAGGRVAGNSDVTFGTNGAGVVELEYEHSWDTTFSTGTPNSENLWCCHLFARSTADDTVKEDLKTDPAGLTLDPTRGGGGAIASNSALPASCNFVEIVLLQGSNRILGSTTLSVAQLLGSDGTFDSSSPLDVWVNLPDIAGAEKALKAHSKSVRHLKKGQLPQPPLPASKPLWSVRLRLAQIVDPLEAVLAARGTQLKRSHTVLQSHLERLNLELKSGNLGVPKTSDEDAEAAAAAATTDAGNATVSLQTRDVPLSKSAQEAAAAGAEAAAGIEGIRRELSILVSNASEMLLPSEVSLDSNVQAYVAVRAYNAAGEYVPGGTVRTEPLPLNIEALPPRDVAFGGPDGSTSDSGGSLQSIELHSQEPLGIFLAPLASHRGDGTIIGLLVTGKDVQSEHSERFKLDKITAGCVITHVRRLELDGMSFEEALAQISAPQRPLLIEFERSMKYLYERNQSRARQRGHLNRNCGSVAWDQLLVPVTREQEKELQARAKEASAKKRRRGGGGAKKAAPGEPVVVEDVQVAELEIFVYIRDSSSRPFMAVHRGDEHEVVKNVAYLLGQEQVLGELAATTVGVAPIAEGDCAIGMTRITVKKSRASETDDVWEGEVLLRDAHGSPAGRLTLSTQWKDVLTSRSEILSSHINLDFAGIGLSIVGAEDHCPQLQNYFGRELLYISVLGMAVDYRVHDDDRKVIVLRVHNFQIDNQDPAAEYPTILSRTLKSDFARPMLHLLVIQPAHPTVTTFDCVEFLLQTIELKCDLAMLQGLLGFAKAAFPAGDDKVLMNNDVGGGADVGDSDDDDAENNPGGGGNNSSSGKGARATDKPRTFSNEELLQSVHSECVWVQSIAATEGKQGIFFFSMLNLQPIKVNVTFTINTGQSLVESLGFLSDVAIMRPLLVMVNALGAMIGNIDGAELRLKSFYVENLLGTQDVLTATLTTHYVSQLIKNSYAIFGSLDFLGNPLRLAKTMGTGFKDFFFEPTQGLMSSPEDFAKGLSKGARSLMEGFGATFHSGAKFMETINKGLTKAAFDTDYERSRAARLKRDKVHNGLEGLTYGAKSLGLGLAEGISGVFVQPVKMAMREGVGGFFKGIGMGLTGLVVKPVAGVVDFLTSTMQGASKSAEFFNRGLIVRVRQPRAIFSDRTIMRFSAREAEGLHICWSLRSSHKHVMSDYVFHTEIAQRILKSSAANENDKGRQAVVLTTDELRCYEIDHLLLRAATNSSLLWRVKLEHLQRVSVDGCAVRFYSASSKKDVHGKTEAPVVFPVTVGSDFVADLLASTVEDLQTNAAVLSVQTAARREFLQTLRLHLLRKEAKHNGTDWLHSEKGVQVARGYVTPDLANGSNLGYGGTDPDARVAVEVPEPRQLSAQEVLSLLQDEIDLAHPQGPKTPAPWRIVKAVISSTSVVPERKRTICGPIKSKFVSYTIDLYAAPTDCWLQQQGGSASCRRVFGRDGFSAQFPFLLKWSVARRYAQFRQLALQMRTKSLISALPPRQGSKVSEAVTANRKVYFSRFLRRLLPKQGVARIKEFLAGGMVDIEWVRANTIVGALASIERSEEEDDGESEQRRRSGSRRGGGPATVRGSTLDTIDESD